MEDIWQGKRGAGSIQEALQSLLYSVITRPGDLGSHKDHHCSWRLLQKVCCVQEGLRGLLDLAPTEQAAQQLLCDSSHRSSLRKK